MKIQKYILIIAISFILVMFIVSNISQGTLVTKFKGYIDNSKVDTSDVKDIGGQIVGIIQITGTIVSVATLMIIGIKYVLGSAEERATYKKSLLPYFIGAVLIFGAVNLTQIIYSWAIKIK